MTSAVKIILSRLWQAKQSRIAQPPRALPTTELFNREFSRRGFVERYREPTEAGKWVTIGADGGHGGTPVMLDGSGQIVKGPAALTGKPVGDLKASPGPQERQDDNDSPTFDETAEKAANASLMRTGAASHGGTKVRIVDHPQGKQYGYAAEVERDGQKSHVTAPATEGGGGGTSWKDAHKAALGALREGSTPKTSGKTADAPETKRENAPKDARGNGDDFHLTAEPNKEHQRAEHQTDLFDKGMATLAPPPGTHDLPDGRRLGATHLPPSDLHVDPTRFQYKISGIDPKTGVTKELQEVSHFNPLFAGQLLVWHDPADGRTYVVNGHHRAELAKRSKYEGKLAVHYIDAKTAGTARAVGALANIAEGRGSAIDAAKFMRDSGRSIGDLQSEGISLAGKVAADGAVLSKMSDRIFQDLTNGLTTEARALSIGRHITKPGIQDQCYRALKKKESGPRGKEVPDSQVEEIAREFELAGSTTDKLEGGLFGDLDSEESLVFQRADIKSYLRKELSAERNTFKAVSTKKRVGRIGEQEGNTLNVEANKHRADSADAALWSYNQLANLKGPVAEAIQQAAEILFHSPKKRKEILNAVKKRIVDSIRAEAGENQSSGVQGSGQDSSGNAGDGAIGAAEPQRAADGTEGTRERFAREFARRGYVMRGPERAEPAWLRY